MIFRQPVTFANGAGGFERATHLRGMSGDLLLHRHAAVLPIRNDRILIDLSSEKPGLGWMQPGGPHAPYAPDGLVFLGLIDQNPCFAADFSAAPEAQLDQLFGVETKFIDLRSIAGQLDNTAATLAATAKGVVGWHLTHPRCARCGGPTVMGDGGWRRQCQDCGAQHFTRPDPVVIMLVVRGEHVLLGRQAVWPKGLYSLLAGFMEPGETIDDAVRRETMEEAGVQVGWVRYVACQPWPFPSSLMLGCVAEATTEAITRNDQELEDALWLDRDTMAEVLAGVHPTFASPRQDAISRALLTAWVRREIDGV